MKTDGLVLGLLDRDLSEDSRSTNKLRDFTISWSRYGYHERIIEDVRVDEILIEAGQQGFRYCLIQSCGHILQERWTGDGGDFFSVLRDLIRRTSFLVMGSIAEDTGLWHGFQPGCLLVDLRRYHELGEPKFGEPIQAPVELPQVVPVRQDGRLVALQPDDGKTVREAGLAGWNLIAASLTAGLPVCGWSEALASRSLQLADSPAQARAFARYLGEGITQFRGVDRHPDLSSDQAQFLSVVAAQTAHARQGVFLWNIESYEDIERPRDDFRGPISTLYTVAAGFKPNRILRTHGFDASSRVVYFDYSRNALDVKKCMLREWDGEDFPRFVKYLFQKFPYPETFYQLWDDLTPDDLDERAIEAVWDRELTRWGGSGALRDHWQAYRSLQHEFVHCDLLTNAAPLLNRVTRQDRAVMWWSNAFFTMYGNWYFTAEHRQRSYEAWIERTARLNPELYLYGSDYSNANVNAIQAGEYWHAYQLARPTHLNPCQLFATEIRM